MRSEQADARRVIAAPRPDAVDVLECGTAGLPVDVVRGHAGDERIVPGSPSYAVRSGAADEQVAPPAAGDAVVARAADENIVGQDAGDEVVAVAAVNARALPHP